ncbi:biorientation of chromosomes in cell division 1 like 1 [Holotrichia oblita]|uniref:Biorientation of chromosomes in cell division 1 like 1 n=1 Tax=Holotrichia oblita TaxID=644536 RepID=A0ACB9T0Z7_HOLOL|nr:biorientation of chromosomes in cell division 1 like 1 [Holotrichia oblita]
MAVVQNYLPGDPLLIDKIVYELKSQGIFDQFRKECIADVDTKPAYQNLRQRVEGSVSGFLNKQKWSPDMNKNQLREMLRKNIYESGFLETGVERIVDQVVNPKINSIFLPKVTEVVYKFLGIEKKSADDRNLNLKLPSNDNLLPTDLEAVSPESEKRFNISNNSSQNLDDSKIDEDESPPFEPLEEKPVYTIAPEENSMDSHLSGFSGLMSHDSNHSQEISKTTQMEVSNQDSAISKQSSEGRLSIVMSDDNDTKMEICDDSLQQKPHKTQAKNFNFQTDVTNNTTTGRKSDNKQEEKSSKSTKKDDKHKSKHDKDGKKDDKDSRKSEKDRKDHKHSSKDKDRDRKDSTKSGRSDSKSDRSKSRHSTSNRSSSKKESSSSSKERSKSSSSSSKDKESKHKDDKTKHSSSKHESRSDKHKKDDKHKSDRHSSSSSKNRDKKDPKKDKKENKDDHFSSKKRTDRRSTDRDSNDGHSGLKSSSSSFDSYSSSQTQGKSQESSNSNSTNSNNGSGGDSNSDCVEGITTALGIAPLKLIKPKFASNIHEARRLMKIRKQINLLEKQNLLNAAKLITQKLIENKRKSIENEKKNSSKPNSPEIKRKDPSPPPLSPPLKSSIVSAATWDALEAKLHESINYTTRYDGLENDDNTLDEQEIVIQNKDDCLYLKDDNDEKVERYRKFTSEYITNLENSIEGTSSQPSIKKDILEETLRNNNINKGVKRKFSDYNSDVKNNNNKKFNTHHIEVHENFSLPLSPAESDNSIDKKSDMSDSSDKAVKKIETELVVKRTNRGASNNQRYSSEELYKPRLMFGGSRRRKGRNLGLD